MPPAASCYRENLKTPQAITPQATTHDNTTSHNNTHTTLQLHTWSLSDEECVSMKQRALAGCGETLSHKI